MKTRVLYGPRLGRQGEVRVGCCAVVFESGRRRILLTQRADNGHWCLPGGRIEAGESVSEACVREVFEETGLEVRITRLIGVYSNPDQLVVYPDGRKVFMVVLSFEVEPIGGQLHLSDETTDFGYFTVSEMESMPIHGQHRERAMDALTDSPPLIK